MSFENAFVSNGLCCPSRATIMRGRYVHNTGVWTNHNSAIGGWEAYNANKNEDDNVATRLRSAGYRTALIGKYLNGYHDTKYRPPGWSKWFATFDGTGGSFRYYDYDVNDNGTIKHYGSSDDDYKTDVIRRETNAFIRGSASAGSPFFAYVTPIAPHIPSRPAPRDTHVYDGLKAARPPSFNERDVSDKPSWIRNLPRLTSDEISQIDTLHEHRAESLQAVDDLVAGTVSTLKDARVMNDTYVFFTSDNGYHEGEHRIQREKGRLYEEDVHVPLLVRGPDVDAGFATRRMALNTDYLPTFMDLACTSSPCDTQNWTYVPDGRSLEPVLHRSVTGWRDAVLLESRTRYVPPYDGIRTSGDTRRKYVEYEGEERELYDLVANPHELDNLYDPMTPPSRLVSRMQDLKSCAGDACRAAEYGP